MQMHKRNPGFTVIVCTDLSAKVAQREVGMEWGSVSRSRDSLMISTLASEWEEVVSFNQKGYSYSKLPISAGFKFKCFLSID